MGKECRISINEPMISEVEDLAAARGSNHREHKAHRGTQSKIKRYETHRGFASSRKRKKSVKCLTCEVPKVKDLRRQLGKTHRKKMFSNQVI